MDYHFSVGPLRISFQRSVKLTQNESARRLQSYGALPVVVTSETVVLVPVANDESVWLGLDSQDDQPAALRVIVEGPEPRDAITGIAPVDSFETDPQNYVVVPPQYSLEGVTVTPFCAKQFVRQLDSPNQALVTGFHFIVVQLVRRISPKSNDTPRRLHASPAGRRSFAAARCQLTGLAEQRIEPDPYDFDAWNLSRSWTGRARFLSTDEFRSTTGLQAPGPLDPSASYGGWRLP